MYGMAAGQDVQEQEQPKAKRHTYESRGSNIWLASGRYCILYLNPSLYGGSF